MDEQRLVEWLESASIAVSPPLTLTLIAGGRSNLTYRVDDSAGRSYVLRRPPTGGVLQSAHDMGREHRIISALADTPVPVPTTFGHCEDLDVIGAPFYVMNLVPGVVVTTDSDGGAYPRPARAAASAELIDVLARIHLLDLDAIGLNTLARRGQYLQRQLKRWHHQFHASTGRDLPMVDEVHRRLSRTIPVQRFTGLVHGDYRPGNLLLAPDGRVNAVLDWELATLGDTMADLGWLLATWREPGEVELLESPTAHPGFLRRDELVELYARATGRAVDGLDYYLAFALWRLTCISEGIYQRYQTGAMGDDGFDVEWQREQVSVLAAAALHALDRAG
ncbi:aminoglycoside phosphotransferase (APT) family kinase protein [Jatrophihabitans sp. GAS493]|uniref:phosphotransferase family protein n=1 Tax=Jatrophihabitans sp. GAS493 TaxID=1907575 RepID=UPI000BB6C618|nr:phosphotransferase family protein [Jatrophihabitans sp. GAS493]SOD74634.1 aminoglycoside phosphotransferase (APT) family kinase protein [Jatrophihabitans sp. GAS493]